MQIEDSDGVNYVCPDYDNVVTICSYIEQKTLAHVFWNRNVLASNGIGTVVYDLAVDSRKLNPGHKLQV
jgi:hypothetical protein